jgi:hypothetical protein
VVVAAATVVESALVDVNAATKGSGAIDDTSASEASSTSAETLIGSRACADSIGIAAAGGSADIY